MDKIKKLTRKLSISSLSFTQILYCISLCFFNFCIVYADNFNDAVSLRLGKDIYQMGLLPNGKPLQALDKNGLPFKIERTACVQCHRTSGLGTSESGLLIPPITGKYLFKHKGVTGDKLLDFVGVPRPIYDEISLKTAIRSGIRPSGGELHEIMPRYILSDTDLNHLIVYLKSLSKVSIPGLKDDQIKFATVFTPEAKDDDKALMLDLIKTYIANINMDVRQLGHMKNPLHGRYKPFRKWDLQVWELTGDKSTWKAQLEKKYSRQPVFAILSGIGDWQTIHEFSEENKIPSLFPITDTPLVSNKTFYNLYFSKGITLDANVVVDMIKSSTDIKGKIKILQIYDDSAASLLAAKTLINQTNEETSWEVKEIKWEENNAQSNLEKYKLINAAYQPNIVIIWLNKKQTLSILKSSLGHQLPEQVYLSSRLLKTYDPEPFLKNISKVFTNRISLIHPFYLKTEEQNHLIRTKAWARTRKIEYKKEHIFANTYFSLALITGAIHTSRYNLNREYLLEQFEHMTDNTVYRSIYPHLSLGPDQRYAAKGTYIVKYTSEIISEWKIPN